MKILTLLLLPLLLFSDEYFAKIKPFETYDIASKASGLVTYTNEAMLSHVAKNQTIVKLDDKISQATYNIASSTYKTRKSLYENLKKVSSRAKSDKDKELITLLSAKQAYVSAKDDLEARDIKAKGLYISKIFVKKGNYVNPGTKLIQAYDTSKSKITLYVSYDDIKNIKSKKILVNGKSDFKLYKFFSVADSVRISSYEVQLVGPAQKEFSQIAKVEIK